MFHIAWDARGGWNHETKSFSYSWWRDYKRNR
jgi:hypothetical protein